MSMNAMSFESRLTIMTTDVGIGDLDVGGAQPSGAEARHAASAATSANDQESSLLCYA